MKLQTTFGSDLFGMHGTQVEQDRVVHNSSAQMAAAGQLHDGKSSVQEDFRTRSWLQSVQPEELWHI